MSVSMRSAAGRTAAARSRSAGMPAAGPGRGRLSPGDWRTVTGPSSSALPARAWTSAPEPGNRCPGTRPNPPPAGWSTRHRQPRPPRSLPAPGTACVSCSPSTRTAYPAATRSPASTLSKPSAPASGPPLAHENPRGRRESRPSCVHATAGLSRTQLDQTPPAAIDETSVTCGNAGQGDRLHGSRPRTADPRRPGPLNR